MVCVAGRDKWLLFPAQEIKVQFKSLDQLMGELASELFCFLILMHALFDPAVVYSKLC